MSNEVRKTLARTLRLSRDGVTIETFSPGDTAFVPADLVEGLANLGYFSDAPSKKAISVATDGPPQPKGVSPGTGVAGEGEGAPEGSHEGEGEGEGDGDPTSEIDEVAAKKLLEDLNGLTVKELIKLSEVDEIDIGTSTKKADIIERIFLVKVQALAKAKPTTAE